MSIEKLSNGNYSVEMTLKELKMLESVLDQISWEYGVPADLSNFYDDVFKLLNPNID